jgi:hypothetical protein
MAFTLDRGGKRDVAETGRWQSATIHLPSLMADQEFGVALIPGVTGDHIWLVKSLDVCAAGQKLGWTVQSLKIQW